MTYVRLVTQSARLAAKLVQRLEGCRILEGDRHRAINRGAGSVNRQVCLLLDFVKHFADGSLLQVKRHPPERRQNPGQGLLYLDPADGLLHTQFRFPIKFALSLAKERDRMAEMRTELSAIENQLKDFRPAGNK